MTAQTLLVELSTEELPPKALRSLGDAFARLLLEGLRERALVGVDSTSTMYATPRRLAASVTNVLDASLDQPFTQKLMPAAIAFDADGRPTIALARKLQSLGREHLVDASHATNGIDSLVRASDGKTEAVFLRSIAKGRPLDRGLQEALDDTLGKLPIPKVMSYAGPGRYYNDTKFVRPGHQLVVLHGSRIVGVSALGLIAGRHTGGHRFLCRADLEIRSAEAYEPTLEAEGKVIPSFAKRRETIVAQLAVAAAGANVIAPDALLDEVTALVEWPRVYTGGFDPAFLALPPECLVLTMQQNQKYFALSDESGKLQNRFLVVSNIDTQQPDAIVRGNERVLRARLSDAKFFFDQDRRIPLEDRSARLRDIVYHHQLGSVAERVERVRMLALGIAPLIGADATAVERAALLSKADLVTDMVGEFPELQGLMGRYYARHDGESDIVADAIEQHYWPRFAGDRLPDGPVAQAIALADKLEALAGMFGIGNEPTGDKDPYGLRRAALGTIRILIERRAPVSLVTLLDLAFSAFAAQAKVSPRREALLDFIYERLRGYLRELGYTANQVSAVVDSRPQVIADLPMRLEAVRAFESLEEAQALSLANKRIINILRKSGEEAAPAVDRSLFSDDAERDLYRAFQHLEPAVHADCARGDYAAALKALATAKPVVDRFFDDVLVMTDDDAVRANRLALLRGIAQTMNRVADISKLAA